jgi:hypothetical protein
MAYVTQEAREELLDAIAAATEDLGVALAALGAAYERLDERSGDRLEEDLFRPVQLAYGRAKRTHSGFAERHRLPGRTFEPASSGAVSQTVGELLDRALDAVAGAEDTLVELQDSMRPVEIGDAELRAGMSEVRELIAPLPDRAREFTRRLGR